MTISDKQLHKLQLLSIYVQHRRRHLLKYISKSCIKAVCDCTLNTLHGNIPLKKVQKEALKRHKTTLRKLSDRKVPLFKKRKLIIQNGGFLQILIPAALTALSTIFNGVR